MDMLLSELLPLFLMDIMLILLKGAGLVVRETVLQRVMPLELLAALASRGVLINSEKEPPFARCGWPPPEGEGVEEF
jgi:hypothetical protein